MLPHIQRREHQEKALIVAKETLNRGKIPCLTIPTGGGKTLVGVDIAEKAVNFNPNAKVLIISNLSPLMSQWDSSVYNFLGAEVSAYTDFLWGKKQRSQSYLEGKKIIIAMAQTIESRQWIPSDVSVVIWDEAHLSWFRQICKEVVFRLAPNANNILLTATPHRLDGQEFGDNVEINQIVSLRKLIEQGYLVPFRAKRIGNFQIKTRTGDKEDYTTAEIEQIIEKCSPEKVYEEWLKNGLRSMPTIGVAPSKAQCKIYCDYFNSQGALGVVVSDETPEGNDAKAEDEVREFYLAGKLPKTRKGACALFRQGKILLWSVRVLTIGFDEPCAQAMLFLSATKSPGQLTQSVGRILRKFEGNEWLPPKTESYVLDFTGSMVLLGRPDEIEDWNDVNKVEGKECPDCGYICGKSQDKCPDCGYKFPKAKPKEKEESSLNLIGLDSEEDENNYGLDTREMEEIPYLDKNAEPVIYYQQLLRRLYASGTNPDKAYYEFRLVKKFDPSRDWATHAVFGSNPTFDNAALYLAYLRKIQSYAGKNEGWVWTKMQNEFGSYLTPIWKTHLTNSLKVVLAG
jgi:superfamily II DNA or RNA helicase